MQNSSTDKLYIFGYGSLASPEDAAFTLGRTVEILYPYKLVGWVRDWSVVVENATLTRKMKSALSGVYPLYVSALNVRLPRYDEAATDPNGVLIEVSQKEIDLLDNRESHYDRFDVTASIEPQVNGIVFTYTGMSKHIYSVDESITRDVVLPGSYVQLVEDSFARLGQKMFDDYKKSTLLSATDIHETLIDD